MLDDGNDDAMRDLAARYGVGYIRRAEHTGAKAGNINHALTHDRRRRSSPSSTPTTWPTPSFLEATLGYMDDPEIAFVQTPQYYANTDDNRDRRGVVGPAGAVLRRHRPRQGRARRRLLLRHQRAVPPRGVRERRRLPDELAHRGLRALDPPPREGLELGVRAGRARARARARRTWPPTSPSSSAGPGAACRGSRARCARSSR